MNDKENLRNYAKELLNVTRIHEDNSNPVFCKARLDNIQAVMIARGKFQQAATPKLILAIIEESEHVVPKDGDGVIIIAEERFRQRTEEGFDDEHDARHEDDELAMAAVCYALPDKSRYDFNQNVPFHWRWGKEDWKPTSDDRIRELAKVGALIAAEIDRLMKERENSED